MYTYIYVDLEIYKLHISYTMNIKSGAGKQIQAHIQNQQ